MTTATETTLPIYEQTAAALASGCLLSAPACEVCADSGSARCHCRSEPGWSWFGPPVHGRDGATTVLPVVDEQREAQAS